MSVAAPHRWRLVAPWYRWDRRAAPDPIRAAAAQRPAIQKFTTDTFMDRYQSTPQASAVFTDDDHVHRIDSLPILPAFTTGPNANKTRQFVKKSAVKTETRKLFLPAHQRYYLVTLELHCDAAGFPSVTPDQIDQCGFVLRRRVTDIPSGQEREVATMLADLTLARARLSSNAQVDAARLRSRSLVPVFSRARQRVVNPRVATLTAQREVIEAKRRLAMWSVDNNVITTTQGWVPVEGNVGGWAPVADRPDVIVETAYPLFKLAPDPTKPDHDARFGTILFGLVPTTLADVDSAGRPRLDDVNVYEIRCFVRRRSDDHCPGELVWSEPTEAFRVASPFDPVGCGYRAVNVRLPDLNDLEATLARPNVRMSSPPNSHLMFATDPVPPEDGTVGAAEEICFFAIPLITIVAFFLLNLFLPIVLFVFQLWFLLKLKFCIPPSIELGAGATAELSVIPGGFQAMAGIDIDIHTGIDQTIVRDGLRSGLNAKQAGLGDTMTAALTNNAIIQALIAQGAGTDGEPDRPVTAIEAPVRRDEVVHP